MKSIAQLEIDSNAATAARDASAARLDSVRRLIASLEETKALAAETPEDVRAVFHAQLGYYNIPHVIGLLIRKRADMAAEFCRLEDAALAAARALNEAPEEAA